MIGFIQNHARNLKRGNDEGEKMKKTISLMMGATAIGAIALLTGCSTTEPDKEAYFAELNNFVVQADTYTNHEKQKTEDLANVLLNSSKVTYVATGVAMRDTVELRFGDAETLRVSQSLFNSAYNKKWEAIRQGGNDDASKKKAAAAEADLKKAAQQIVSQQTGVKKTADQLYTIILQKNAQNDFINYKHELKAAQDKAAVEKKYAKEKAWLTMGKEVGEKGILTKEARAKAAAREKEINKAKEALDKDLHRVGNTIKYWGAFGAKAGAPIAYQVAVQAANGNPLAITGAKIAMQKTIEAADKAMAEVLQEQPEEKDRFNLPLNDPKKCVEIINDKVGQYQYALDVANNRNMYVLKALKWLHESNEAVNDAAGE